MPKPELVSGTTRAGIDALLAELAGMLVEAKALRVRVMMAGAANVWPELHSASVFRIPPSADNQHKTATKRDPVQARRR